MKQTKAPVIFIVVISVIIITCLIVVNSRMAKEIAQLEKERKDLKKIIEAIASGSDIDDNVKQKLLALQEEFKSVDASVADEIAKALQFFQINQHESAIKCLVKVMEHQLSKKLKGDTSFLSWLKERKRKKCLNEMLEYAKDSKLIQRTEYSFYVAIKEVRNAESHEVGFRLSKELTLSGVLSAVHGITRLAKVQ